MPVATPPAPSVPSAPNPERFDHSQAGLPWFVEHQWQAGLGELLRERRLGAFVVGVAAAGVDYLSTNIADTDMFSQAMDRAEQTKGRPGLMARIGKRVGELNDKTAEWASRKAQAARRLGTLAVNQVVSTVTERVDKFKTGRTGDEDHLRNLPRILMEGRIPAPSRLNPNTPPSRIGYEPGETEAVLTDIENYNEKFKDPTYVPTTDEYEDMSELADYIHVDHTTLHPANPATGSRPYINPKMRYDVAGAKGVDPYTVRSFLDALSPNRWQLSEEDLRDAAHTRALLEPGIRAGQKWRSRETRNDYLNYDDYMKLHYQATGTVPGPGRRPTNALDDYRAYLKRRSELSELLRIKLLEQFQEAAQAG